jgi:hypothetical protein
VTWRAAPLIAASMVAAGITASEGARAEAPSVEIVATGDETATSAVESLVRELLRDLAVEIHWTRAPSIDPREVLSRRPPDVGLLARVWVDLSDPLGARMFIANATSDHFLVRIVPATKGDDDKKIENEAVAQIVSSSVQALLAGGNIGVTREAAVRQVELVAPPPVPDVIHVEPRTRPGSTVLRELSGEVGAFVALRGLGTGPILSFDTGLMGTLAGPRRWPVRPILILALQWDAPRDWQTHTIGVQLEGAGGSVQAGVRTQLGARVSLQASVGLGPEEIRVDPQAVPNAGFNPKSPFWVAAAMLTTRIGVEVLLVGPLSAFAMAGGDIDTSGVQFNVNDNGTLSSDVVPWRIWPVALLGASLALGGDPAPAP